MDVDTLVITIIVDNTSTVGFLTSAILQTYQILISLMKIYSVDLKINVITIYPQIRVTHRSPTESIQALLNRLSHSHNVVSSPSDEMINNSIDLIDQNSDIILILDRYCMFKKDRLVHKNHTSVIISIYNSMKYDRDYCFYESRGILTLRLDATSNKIINPKEIDALLVSEQIVNLMASRSIIIRDLKSVLATSSILNNINSESKLITTKDNHVYHNLDSINGKVMESILMPYILELYLLNSLFRSINTGYLWKQTDTMIFDFPQLPENSNSNKNYKKLTIKEVLDYLFMRIEIISNNVITIYQNIVKQCSMKDDYSEYELGILTMYCRYLISNLLTAITSYMNLNTYSGPSHETQYPNSKSHTNDSSTDDSSTDDSSTDDFSTDDSEYELDINISQISKVWLDFNSQWSARICKKIDLNFPSELRHKIKSVFENRENFIDQIEDQFEKNISEKDRTFYTSALTLRTWIDALRTGNTIGLNMNIDITENKKHMYNVCLLSIPKLYGTTSEFFDGIKQRGIVDIKTNDHCLDSVFGNSNVVLPLFINNQNWKIAKHYVDPICNMIVNNSHLVTDPRTWRIYYIILIDFLSCIRVSMMSEIGTRETKSSLVDNSVIVKYRDYIKKFFTLWFTAYNLTRDRKVMNIAGYIDDAIENNREMCAGMIGGQALTLFSASIAIKDKFIDHVIRNIVQRNMKRINNSKITVGTILDNYNQMFRLTTFQFSQNVFKIFFEKVPEREFVRTLISNYSIVPDTMLDDFIRIMFNELKFNNPDDDMLSRINNIIYDERNKIDEIPENIDDNPSNSQKKTTDFVLFT